NPIAVPLPPSEPDEPLPSPPDKPASVPAPALFGALGAASFSTGAGCSGSAPPEGSSIHRTISPSEYVCSALNTSWLTFGSGPSETSNSWNCPGLMAEAASAVQVIFVIASVTSPSSVLSGVASLVFSGLAVHPFRGLTDTDAIG